MMRIARKSREQDLRVLTSFGLLAFLDFVGIVDVGTFVS